MATTVLVGRSAHQARIRAHGSPRFPQSLTFTTVNRALESKRPALLTPHLSTAHLPVRGSLPVTSMVHHGKPAIEGAGSGTSRSSPW